MEKKYKTLIGMCPWLFTQAEYAAACTAAIKQGDTEALEELSRVGRKYQFPEKLGRTPSLKEIVEKEKLKARPGRGGGQNGKK